MNPRTMLFGQRTSGLAGWSLRAAGWVCLCASVLSAQFEDVTTAAGLTDSTAYCAGAAWGDYNNDGFPDLFIAAGGGASHTNFLYRNAGNGAFVKAGPEAGPIVTSKLTSFGGAWVDLNNDGQRDLVVVNGAWSPARSELYWNHGDGTFGRGSAGPLTTRSVTTSWPVCADYDGDGWVDLYLAEGNSASGPFLPQLYRATGHGTFTPAALEPAIAFANDAVWGDYDNDGRLDLFLARESASCRLFRNQEDGNFVEVSMGSPVKEGSATQSASWADYDNDGDLDFFVAGISAGRNYLYQNNGNGNHWLKIRLRGTASNSHAVGARVFARATLDGKQVRQMRTITAHSASQELEAHFGLVHATKVTLLRVEWPSGTVQEYANVAVDQMLTLWELPVLQAAMPAGGACQLSIRAEPNRSWQIQASSDLAAWTTLTTVKNTTVGFTYTDASAVGLGNRFYRLVGE